MRSVPGLQRAGVQWTVITLCVILVGVTAFATLAFRRSSDTIRALDAEIGELRTESAQLESQLVRERSTREALALELARQRSDASGTREAVPTLTLHPAATRRGDAPAQSVTAPPAERLVQLRLVLLEGAAVSPDARLEITLREWSSGKTIWSRSGLRVGTLGDRAAVISYIAGDVLATGSYEVLVRSESTELAAYDLGIK